ncbi:MULTISPECIES: class I SAM-dependent methyltransferase [Micromonospora]|uniref:class I SAM-dependent methyltransferase n=1 Tax=Micromonospora TaxID=1873 RepID=UPI000F873E88|nr:SAM-dependent methyltransferase [Verrucosispora sp. FIM060022]RUL93742.1 SAM-dependent methyltransferase [Verrucosispora sp. FIM060022]
MPEPLDAALAEVRSMLLGAGLTRAVAAGRRRGQRPSVVRAELRPVALKAGSRLQIVTSDGARPYTRNVAPGPESDVAVEALLAEPFGNWHVETTDLTLQLRVTKSGEAQVHRRRTAPPVQANGDQPGAQQQVGTTQGRQLADTAERQQQAAGVTERWQQEPASQQSAVAVPGGHDRAKAYLLDPGDPIFAEIGGSAAKRRQVDAFLRALAATLPGELTGPLRVVDLGCGNAYLTFAAYRYLSQRGLDVELVGVDVREDQRRRNTELAERLGWADRVRFVAGSIADAVVEPAPDLVLALHACDTATDEALARAVRWGARWVLAAPCCHHDVAAQLRAGGTPAPYGLLTRQGILRERFADVLTDALRAALLRLHGYRAEVVEFVESAHTPRNLLIRARRTGAAPTRDQQAEYRQLVEQWRVAPRLETLLSQKPADR